MATINFKGKEIVRNHHLTIPYHELVPDAKKTCLPVGKGLSKKPSLNDNLIIHGDNLLALKALLPTYAGKVKCIYIDPPYNTGNEKWAYNDNVNSPMMKDWLGKVVDKDDLTRHDKWLCMMMPRLKLLRELLRDDGVIFVSIDDNEIANSRALMDEIFGEENFLANFIWKKKGTITSTAKNISVITEYVLCYQKSEAILNKRFLEKVEYPFTDKKSKYRRVGIETSGSGQYARPSMLFPILGVRPHEGRRWKIGEEAVKNLISDNHIEVIKGSVYLKKYEGEEIREAIYNNLFEEHGTSQSARSEVNLGIFGIPELFATPKPTELIKHLLQIGTDKDSIILDSFAGSGTTAHAVLDLNKEDGGSRKFILVEMEDYADKITAERVRRVIKGVKTAKDENLKNGLGGSFSYFELGKPIDTERILKGKDLPTFAEMARYIFYTATSEEFNEKKVNEKSGFIGESKEYQVYLLYKPDMEYLKSTALTLERAETLGKFTGKKRLIFAPAKYLDQEHLLRYHIDFAQLPFEIYQKAK